MVSIIKARQGFRKQTLTFHSNMKRKNSKLECKECDNIILVYEITDWYVVLAILSGNDSAS